MTVARGVRVAYGVAIAMLLVSALGFRAGVVALDLYLKKEPVPLRRALSTVPPQLGQWKQVGPDGVFSAEILESLGTEQYLDRSYALDGDPSKGTLSLHVAYYTGMIDAVPHVPERCWGAAGLIMTQQPKEIGLAIDRQRWAGAEAVAGPASKGYPSAVVLDPVTRRPETVHMPIGDFTASVTEFQDQRSPSKRLVGGYFFIANGRTTSSAYVVRTYAFDLSNRYAYYCKVQVSGTFPEGSSAAEWSERAGDLVTSAMPYIMRCLPDWPEWESAKSR